MNRKMRSKLNNQIAREKRERPPQTRSVPIREVHICNECANELGNPTFIAVGVPAPEPEKLN